MKEKMNRRRFIKLGLMTAAAAGLAGCNLMLKPHSPGEPPEETEKELQKVLLQEAEREVAEAPIPRRRLGKTGYYTSILGLGGAFIVAQGHLRDEAVAIINRALDLGVNYIDTAPT